MINRVRNRLRGRRRAQRKPTFLSERLLRALAADSPNATFIEIGANDGEQEDHIKEFIRTTSWSGVMVEPVDYVYERLAANYGSNPRISLERAVISESDGTVPFFYLEPPGAEELDSLPEWYDGIGSLSREAVLSHGHLIPDIESRLRADELPSLTLDSLCTKHGLDAFDLLVVDTEGYDAELLSHADLNHYGPRVVIYEHFHLGAEDRQRCRLMLGEQGYETREEGFDTLCVRSPAEGDVGRAWERFDVAVTGVYAESERRG